MSAPMATSQSHSASPTHNLDNREPNNIYSAHNVHLSNNENQASQKQANKLTLGLEHLDSLRIARHFTTSDVSYSKNGSTQGDPVLSNSQVGPNDRINHLDFFSDGSSMVAAHNNDIVKVYDCLTGRCTQDLNSKKYGVDIVKYTHTKDVIIHTSTKVDHAVRYLTLHENRYIRYFRGHTDKVIDMMLSPVNDTIVTSSLDKSMRVWDLRSSNCQGMVNLPSVSVVNIDPQGLIFAVGFNNSYLKLYDFKTYDKGPFSTFNIFSKRNPGSFEWKSIKFTPDGSKIAVMTSTNMLHFVDSFNGELLFTFSDFQNSSGNVDFTFTPNGKYGVCGSSNGKIVVFDTETGTTLLTKNTQHVNISKIAFNPVYALLATAESFIDLWLPYLDESKGNEGDAMN